MSDRNGAGEWAGHKHDKRCYPHKNELGGQDCQTVDCYAQYQWNKKMQRLLAKEPKSMKGFNFMPKGEVS